jgi:hypothetical protein
MRNLTIFGEFAARRRGLTFQLPGRKEQPRRGRSVITGNRLPNVNYTSERDSTHWPDASHPILGGLHHQYVRI